MSDQGKGVNQDHKEAAKWYRKAAEQGDANAQELVGLMYDQGKGVNQDYKEAVEWYPKAAETRQCHSPKQPGHHVQRWQRRSPRP